MRGKTVFLVTLLLFNSKLYAYDNVEVHQLINENAAKQSTNFVNTLKSFGFSGNNPQELIDLNFISGKRIKDWLREGGKQEDAGMRYINHFHDPTKSWDKAGLDAYLGLVKGASSIIWSQNPNQATNDTWSWQNARSYYFDALTASEKTMREKKIADTFRALGQVMHLLADSAVPEHVRNNAHAMGAQYEKWCQTYSQNLSTLATPVDYFLTNASLAPGLAPVSNFWDTTPSPGDNLSPIGLAEYTNFNFLSPKTIFRNYSYPQKPAAGFTLEPVIKNGVTTGKKAYFQGTTSDGQAVVHLVSTGYLWAELSQLAPGSVKDSKFVLDDNCYKDYAGILVPKAVGYSAALLNYFFRGKLDLVWDEAAAGWVIINQTNEAMSGAFAIYTDDATGIRTQLWSNPALSLSAQGSVDQATGAPLDRSAPITLSLPSEDSPLIVVFKGRLGNEEGAVVGRVVRNDLYLLAIPVDHATRESLGKTYYRVHGTALEPVAGQSLPFGLLDDGAAWDYGTQSWNKIDAEGLGVPLGAGGPQYLAKYWDESNKRVRFVANGSYEKEAYHVFHETYTAPLTGEALKTYTRLLYVGSPDAGAGTYDENTGWMEYAGNPINGLLAILPPPGNDPRNQRFFPLYSTLNFNDSFVEAPVFRVYGFNNSVFEQAIPKDPEAPLSSVVSACRPEGATYVNVTVPSVFNTYVMPHPVATPPAALASSGLDDYRFPYASPAAAGAHEAKCTGENNNCGNAYDPGQGAYAVSPVYDIPANFNSKVRVHRNDSGQYYEELYINGNLVDATPAATERLEAHFQILAVHGSTAFVRKTILVSHQRPSLPYWHQVADQRIYDDQWDFASSYAVYINGVRTDLAGSTTVRSHYLDIRPEATPDWSAVSLVRHLTYEIAEDITGYHPDRIFINESFDQQNILVAFDEYAYNDGGGLVHQLKDEPADDGSGQILFFDIPASQVQNADHEATRTGRTILLFKSDGTLSARLRDPFGLSYTIGSVGILN